MLRHPRSRFISVSSLVLVGALVLALQLAAVACNGPTGLLPGGQLEGETSAVPANWQLGESHGVAQLETRPEDPYSVNIAFTIIEGRLYINAGNTETDWAKNIAADSRVRLRVDDSIYEARAERVTNREEIQVFAKDWTSQSWFYRDPAGFDEVWIYRLVERQP